MSRVKTDFNFEELKEKLKGKPPEEIAKIVGSYYEEKYKELLSFPWKRLIIFIIFLIILIALSLILLPLIQKLSLTQG
ncbi:MAG TPA: hypothetical protein ENG68_01595 [bacterium]|nr:hypothetical protein [bacterium]